MNWKPLCLLPDNTIREALQCIDAGGLQCAVVIDAQCRLCGVVTDGNIRRGLLADCTIETPVSRVMNPAPRTVGCTTTASEALYIMQQEEFSLLPVVDSVGVVRGIWSRRELQSSGELPNWVILMAGGLGSRLGALTRDCPKPLLSVGGKPILEIVLQNFMDAGFKNFYISVNYKAHMIMQHFGDGERFGCRIEYLHEKKRLGTAGALGLLPHPLTESCVISNADILTRLDMRMLLQTHQASGAPATMVVKKHSLQIPYGVVNQDPDGRLTSIREKPQFDFRISAGVYVLEPGAASNVPADTFFDMPELFQKLIALGEHPHVLETTEYWLDIGQIEDFQRANASFIEPK